MTTPRTATTAAPSTWLTWEVVPRGVSEIFFQSNAWTGLLILAAFVVADWQMALLALIGATIALAVVFLRSSAAWWVYGAFGAAVAALVTLGMTNLSSEPHYTWPYILTTWVLLVVASFIPALKRP